MRGLSIFGRRPRARGRRPRPSVVVRVDPLSGHGSVGFGRGRDRGLGTVSSRPAGRRGRSSRGRVGGVDDSVPSRPAVTPSRQPENDSDRRRHRVDGCIADGVAPRTSATAARLAGGRTSHSGRRCRAERRDASGPDRAAWTRGPPAELPARRPRRRPGTSRPARRHSRRGSPLDGSTSPDGPEGGGDSMGSAPPASPRRGHPARRPPPDAGLAAGSDNGRGPAARGSRPAPTGPGSPSRPALGPCARASSRWTTEHGPGPPVGLVDQARAPRRRWTAATCSE